MDTLHGQTGEHVLCHVEEVHRLKQDDATVQLHSMAGLSALVLALRHKTATHIIVQVRTHMAFC